MSLIQRRVFLTFSVFFLFVVVFYHNACSDFTPAKPTPAVSQKIFCKKLERHQAQVSASASFQSLFSKKMTTPLFSFPRGVKFHFFSKSSGGLHQKVGYVFQQGEKIDLLVNAQCWKSALNHPFLQGEELAGLEFEGTTRFIKTWTLSKSLSTEEIEQGLQQEPCVIAANVNAKAQATHHLTPYPALSERLNDSLVGKQKHLNFIHEHLVYSSFFEGDQSVVSDTPIKVAVIDTGVDYNHEDLKNQVVYQIRDVQGNLLPLDLVHSTVEGSSFTSIDSDPMDDNGHGTHVAGLLAGEGNNDYGIAGVFSTKGIEVIPIKALNEKGEGSASAVTAAIYLAVEVLGVQVINLSLGIKVNVGDNLTILENEINNAIQKGVVVVAASGNDGEELGVDAEVFPASWAPKYKGLISVGSVDVIDSNRSEFSNWSPQVVEIAAPGNYAILGNAYKGLLSSFWGDARDPFKRRSGTSMAAPLVSGAVALLMAKVKAITGKYPGPEEVELLLLSGSRQQSSLMPFFQKGRVLDLAYLLSTLSLKYPQAVPLTFCD
ncbi:MAG: hypothetical protein D6797_04585 [Bdellovibrio sp.]|nr:MAG: hypothetical protein D6797_04585 [Bdellovibrio sp.]